MRPARVGDSRRLNLAIVMTFALVVALWRAFSGDPLSDQIEERLLDLRFRLRGAVSPPDTVVVVAVDERTVERLGWAPPPRQAIAEAAERVIRAGPAALALDLLLLEQTAAGPMLAATLAHSDRVILAAAVGDAGASATSAGIVEARPAETQAALARSVFAAVVGNVSAEAVELPRLLLPRPELVGGALLGHVNISRSGDRVARRVPLALWIGGRDFLPSMGLQAARLVAGLERGDVVFWAGEGIGLGSRHIATDRAGLVTLNHYGGGGTLKSVSLLDVIDGTVPPEIFRGKAVIFGATAETLSDLFATPFGSRVPGVEVIGTLAANLAAGEEILDAPATGIGLALLAGLCAGVSAVFSRPVMAFAGTAAAWLVAAALLQTGFTAGRLWVDAVSVFAALVFATAWMVAYRLRAERRGSVALAAERSNLARYVSPLLTDHVARGTVATFDRRAQEAAVLFVDVAGFTGFSESRRPSDVAAFLGELHRLYERCAAEHSGVISGFEGDGAMMIFGMPEPRTDDAARAFACGLALLGEAAAFSSDVTPGFTLRLRVSLHFGPVTAAVVGGERQAQVTVTGDTVNVASRLQETAKKHGAVLVLSSECLAAAGAGTDNLIRLPDQPVRGRSRGIEAWALR